MSERRVGVVIRLGGYSYTVCSFSLFSESSSAGLCSLDTIAAMKDYCAPTENLCASFELKLLSLYATLQTVDVSIYEAEADLRFAHNPQLVAGHEV